MQLNGIFCRENGILTATILGSSMVFIDGSVVGVLLPILQKELHVDGLIVQWIADSYLLTLSALMLIGGALGDRFGRKRIFLAGIALFALSSIGIAASSTLFWISTFRGLQGIGGALLTPTSLALINDTFDSKRRGEAIGTWTAFSTLMVAMGPVAGGFLNDHASWRLVFLINVVIGAITFILVQRVVPRDPPIVKSRTIDAFGLVASTTAIGLMTYGLIQKDFIVTFFGLLVLCCFLYVETRAKDPIVPLSLFRNRMFWSVNLVTFLIYGGLTITFYFMPFYLIQIRGFSATMAGATNIPFVLIMFFLSRWTGSLYDKFGARMPIATGSVLVAAAFALIGLLATPGRSYWSGLLPSLVLFGFGMALVVSPLTTAVMGAVPEGESGVASAINNSVSRVAGLFGTALMTLLFIDLYESKISRISIPNDVKAAALSKVRELGNMQGFSAETKSILDIAYSNAYSQLMFSTALIALSGAIIAILFVPKKP